MEPIAAGVIVAAVQFVIAVIHSIRLQYRADRRAEDGIRALPWPSGWEPASGAAAALLGSGNFGIAVFLIGGAVQNAQEGGEVAKTAFFLALGVMLVPISVGAILSGFPAHRGTVKVRLDTLRTSGEHAVVLASSGERAFVRWGGTAFLGASCVAVLVLAERLTAIDALLSVVAFALAWAVVFATCHGGRDTEVWLAPSGVVVVRGRARSGVSWRAMRVVQASTSEQHRGPALRLIEVSSNWMTNDLPRELDVSPPGRGRLKINPAYVQCDPVLLFHCLAFYRRKSQHRHELGTSLAMQRIQNGHVTESAPDPGAVSQAR